MTFAYWTGNWALHQLDHYGLHEIDIRYRSISIPGQKVFDDGIRSDREAPLEFMEPENIRTYTALLDRVTIDLIFGQQLSIVLQEIDRRYNDQEISSDQYQAMIASNTKAWNPLDAIRSNVPWELKRRNDDRGWFPVKTLGDGEINIVRYEIVLGTLGI